MKGIISDGGQGHDDDKVEYDIYCEWDSYSRWDSWRNLREKKEQTERR
jgi:heme-degrading monooxygenase HmoA